MTRLFLKFFMWLQVTLFNLSGGRIMGQMRGLPVLLLTTTGAKSGKRRTVPLLYIEDGDEWVIIASNGGEDTHPGWYHNVRKTPHVTVKTRAGEGTRMAAVASEDRAAALWPKVDAMTDSYAGYRAKTDRTIPIVLLSEDGAAS